MHNFGATKDNILDSLVKSFAHISSSYIWSQIFEKLFLNIKYLAFHLHVTFSYKTHLFMLMVQLFLKQTTIAQRVIQIDLKVTMNMTGSPLIKLNLLHKNKATQLKSHYFKLLRVHLSIVSFHVKKIHWFINSISISSLFIHLATCLTSKHLWTYLTYILNFY